MPFCKSSGKESVAKRESCKMNGYRWRRGRPPEKSWPPPLPYVHKKLTPPLETWMRLRLSSPVGSLKKQSEIEIESDQTAGFKNLCRSSLQIQTRKAFLSVTDSIDSPRRRRGLVSKHDWTSTDKLLTNLQMSPTVQEVITLSTQKTDFSRNLFAAAMVDPVMDLPTILSVEVIFVFWNKTQTSTAWISWIGPRQKRFPCLYQWRRLPEIS